MEKKDPLKRIKKDLKMFLVITFIVSIKLVLSFFVPGLKTPAELLWTGFILMIYNVRMLYLYNELKI